MLIRLACAFLLFCATGAAADVCTPSGVICTEFADVEVAGVTIESACVKLQRIEDCTRSNPVDSCGELRDQVVTTSGPLEDGQCREIDRECIRFEAGFCDKYSYTYSCLNGPDEVPGAVLESREFVNFDEQIVSTCEAYENNANCTLETTTTVQSGETRLINLMSVSRTWWQQQRRYDCTNNAYEETCSQYENNPICSYTGETHCLFNNSDGSCEYAEYIYECQSDASFNASCEAINVCVGDNCEGIEQEASSDYPQAAAWLNFLNDVAQSNGCEASPDTDPEHPEYQDCTDRGEVICGVLTEDGECLDPPAVSSEPQVFAGRLNYCRYNGVLSCCNEGGFNNCKPEEVDLRAYNRAGTTHYLGSRCARRFLGICLERRREYCVYDGKLARVFQEQVHVQTGSQFAWRTDEPCPALTLNQLSDIDVEAMDLTEVFGDMLDEVDEPVSDLVIDRLRTSMGVFQGQAADVFE